MKLQPIGYNAVGAPVQLKNIRLTHHHVIGSSGSGKSKFLEQMMRADLRAGQGFCLVDPHGTLYENVLKYCAYQVYTGEIILLNLSEPDYITGFNFFTKDKDGDTNVQVDNLINATLHAWDAKNADSTPTLERILRVIYTTVLDADLTLPQVATLLDFSAKKIREEWIDKIEDDLIRREWEELSNLTKAREFRDEILSAKNRLFRFLTSKTLMRFLGMKGKTIDLTEAMNRQKIILVNLAPSKNKLSKENARVFGSLLVNQFFQAALERKKDASGRDPKPYYLYLDEFQNFVSIDLADMLDEVRKFGLFLVMSHQRFGQLDDNFVDAVLTNCRIKTVFGGLPVESAKTMAEELFIGKIDPMKIKASIYQTKHLYNYVREKVYSKSESYGESDGESEGEGSATASGEQSSDSSGAGNSIGNSYQMDNLFGQTMIQPPTIGNVYTGAMLLSDGTSSSNAESSGFSSMESQSEFSSRSHSTSWSKSEGVADIPVFVPVPYQELSSIQYYTPEEQLLELTQALKLQMQRHCFIQLPNQETQPLLVPIVKTPYLSEKNLIRYVEIIAEKNQALTMDEADREILQDGLNLLQLENTPPDASREIPSEPAKPTQKTTARNKKKTIFDQLKEANPDLEIDD